MIDMYVFYVKLKEKNNSEEVSLIDNFFFVWYNDFMNKKEIFKKLDELELDKDKYIIIGGAALVCLGIKKETNDIDLSCKKNYYNKIGWDKNIGFLM